MNQFKQCPNGHYYQGDECPYCKTFFLRGTTGFSLSRPYLNIYPRDAVYVRYNRHIYVLTSDRTASFMCYSEAAFHLYEDYYDWMIEAYEGEKFHDNGCRFVDIDVSFSIPRSIIHEENTYEVTGIGRGAFAFCAVTSVTIPDTIEQIDMQAFFRCDGLKYLFIPDSVKKLADGAISECKDLKTITWKGVTYEDDTDELFVFPDCP